MLRVKNLERPLVADKLGTNETRCQRLQARGWILGAAPWKFKNVKENRLCTSLLKESTALRFGKRDILSCPGQLILTREGRAELVLYSLIRRSKLWWTTHLWVMRIDTKILQLLKQMGWFPEPQTIKTRDDWIVRRRRRVIRCNVNNPCDATHTDCHWWDERTQTRWLSSVGSRDKQVMSRTMRRSTEADETGTGRREAQAERRQAGRPR